MRPAEARVGRLVVRRAGRALRGAGAAAFLLAGSAAAAQRVRREPFGRLPGGEPVERFVLADGRGVEVAVLSYGAIIQAVRVPDRRGRVADVVLGFPDLDGYLAGSPYFGALVGRTANRIANGTFALDGVTYTLPRNDGPHHLHGGRRGFDKRLWTAEPFTRGGRAGVVLTRTSPDGEEGYPGALRVRVAYTLGPEGALEMALHATTDRATPVNLTQHSYFNLVGVERPGGVAPDVLGHRLTIAADAYTPVDSTRIPTGAIRPVSGTPLDFRRPTAIGARIGAPFAQLRYGGGGYSQNYVLSRRGGQLRLAARLVEPVSGRVLDLVTTEPGLQLYTGQALDGRLVGKSGTTYGRFAGVALEPQHFPDSPNRPRFPSVTLRPGEVYRSRTVYRFGVAP